MEAKAARKLTDEQRAVVAHETGHALVNAVPGSGKTTVLVARMRRLLRIGRTPGSLLAVMFNKSAQLSFLARLQRAMAGQGQGLPQVRTFHSIGNQLNKRLVDIAALQPAKLVVSRLTMEIEAKRALREAWKTYHGGDATPDPDHYASFLEYLTLVKSDVMSPSDVFDKRQYMAICRPFVSAFNKFEDRRIEQRRMYFDDLIYRPVTKLMQSPELWSLFDADYEDIMIDELQDISPIQFEMMRGLAGEQGAVMGVGDPDQSIYGWRGSEVTLMTQAFPRTFAPCTPYPMTRTFRFGHGLALMANHLIVKNNVRDDHLVIACQDNPRTAIEHWPIIRNKPSGIVDLVGPYAAAEQLHRLLMVERNFNHGIQFEIELTEAKIPFFVEGRAPLIWVPEIAAIVCALCLASGKWIVEEDMRSRFLEAILSRPTMYVQGEIIDAIVEDMLKLIDTDPRNIATPLRLAADKVRSSNPRLANNLMDRHHAIRSLASGALINQPPQAVAEGFVRMVDLRGSLQRNATTKEEQVEATATVDAFLAMAGRSATMDEFLDILGPMAAQEAEKPPEGDYLRITSIHRAKGLEAHLVIVVGLGDGSFPGAGMEDTDMEEERRLAFVAITRAIDRLALFHPEDKLLENMRKDSAYQRKQDDLALASRYLYEAEIGGSVAIERALEEGGSSELTLRRNDVGSRYLNEIGCTTISIQTPALKPGQLPPLHRNYRPSLGATLWHPEEGACLVVEQVRHPFYRMQRNDGSQFNDAVTPESPWRMCSQ